MRVKKLFFLIISFLGWVLSPFTWWNDAFVNLPLAYISASIINRYLTHAFMAAFLLSYWFTNLLGVVLMYIGAKGLAPRGIVKNKARLISIMMVIYSIISAFLIWHKVIRPF